MLVTFAWVALPLPLAALVLCSLRWAHQRARPHAIAWLARSYEAEALELVARARSCADEAKRLRAML